MHQIFESFFFSFKIPPLQRKAHNAEEENFVVREISLQTNKQQHEKRGQRKERREQNARKSWPPLSPPLRFYRCSPFRRRLRLVGERGGEGAKEAPIIIRWRRFQRMHQHIQTTRTMTIQRTRTMKTRRRRASFFRRRRRSIRREGDGGGVEQRIRVITWTTIRPKKKKN